MGCYSGTHTREVGPCRMKCGKDGEDWCSIFLYRGGKLLSRVILYDNNAERDHILEYILNNTYCNVEVNRHEVLVSVTPILMEWTFTVESVVPSIKEDMDKVMTKECGTVYAAKGLFEPGYKYLANYDYNEDGRVVLIGVIEKT